MLSLYTIIVFVNDLILICREVVLGEHVIGKEIDCNRNYDRCNPPVIKRKINHTTDIVVHEAYDKEDGYKNDIALIRINDPVPFFQEDPEISSANPICLPWSEDSYAHYIDDGDNAKVVGWNRSVYNFTASKLFRYPKHFYVPIADEKCKNAKGWNIDTTRQICAGGEKGECMKILLIMVLKNPLKSFGVVKALLRYLMLH